MATDPYQTLGVAKESTPDQIRAAYRKLAKKHHPDLNPGSKASEDKFKSINTANDLLSDPEKRARFDRGEIDATGQERAEHPSYRRHADGAQGARYRRGAPGADDPVFADMFADMFRRGGGGGQGAGHGGGGEPIKMRGQDLNYALQVDFTEAAGGAARRLTMPDGRALDVTIPAGLEDGQTLRLRGQGEAGWNGGPAGDALIEVSVRPHAYFRREGNDIHLDLPVTMAEAVLGAKVAVPTLAGGVSLTIPTHSDTGRVLRLRGRGIPAHAGRAAGDLYVTLKLVSGTPDPALEEALKAWAERHAGENPRAAMEGTP